ncbi:copper resistance protein CopC [Microbacterium lushaniae]|nr:copper resistance protein CopC [Microbacterium lushaniae]KAA9159229.1 copper resistance protein CopC [Microbacterium lushaniae]
MSPFRRFSVGVAAAVVLVLGSVAPASAHDQLLSSSPAANDRLDAGPASVSLEFSADLMDVGALIMVADADGEDWAAGDPTVELTTVTMQLTEGMPVGGYEVRWRVVSSDGHPISGVIPFTVGDGEPLQREVAAGGAPARSSDAGENAVQGKQSQNTQENGGVLRVVLIGMAGAAIAVAVLATIYFVRRRLRGDGTDEQATEPSSKQS